MSNLIFCCLFVFVLILVGITELNVKDSSVVFFISLILFHAKLLYLEKQNNEWETAFWPLLKDLSGKWCSVQGG